jgi:cobalt-zinc-cadmium resistance protein CzcA
MQEGVEKALLEFQEVENVFARIGTAEVATDPFGPDRSDVYVMLRPREEWKTAKTKADLIGRMEERLSRLPGGSYEFSQPIELRFNELISGVRSDVAVKVFGEDITTLKRVAQRIRSLLEQVPGAEDVIAESVSGQPVIDIEVDRQAIARHGVNVADVLELVEVAIGGKVAGQIIEAEQRADLLARLPPAVREKPDELAQLTVRTPAGALIPLAELARIQTGEGLSLINRENGQRRLAVLCNVRGRDLGSFIADVQTRIAKKIELPASYRIEYGGQFENLEAARRRLAVVVPVALGLIFFLLFRAFGSARQALLVFTGVPLAVTGGVFSLALRGLPFSISAGVGFIALSGVAVLNGVVMVTYFNRLREDGKPIGEAVSEGALTRLRPVLMTALVASLGFVPMAIATGTGAEVQRPLATVVIGGIVSSTVLTLVILPTLYLWAMGTMTDPPHKRERESRGAASWDEV